MININKVKTYSVKSRLSKVNSADFARIPAKNKGFKAFYDSLPNILRAKDLRCVVKDILNARKRNKSVIFMAGAHVIKCGLNPVVIELIKNKVITCIALNGAGIIHDFELVFQGKTSEDVAENLKTGKFGMSKETAEFINSAVAEGVEAGFGLGSSIARKIADSRLRYKNLSLLFNAYKYKVPVCVFVGIGTDIIHQHPSFDAGLTGRGSQTDFYTLAENIRGINNGGVVLNFGSAVMLPEVFLKALNLARNLGNKVMGFTTANFDMIYQYRAAQNVVCRPTNPKGKGYYIIGHHEIMLPLLAQAITEDL
jgi:hypothetical protein